eukprot:6256417-Karenia_brevis.AAC.1
MDRPSNPGDRLQGTWERRLRKLSRQAWELSKRPKDEQLKNKIDQNIRSMIKREPRLEHWIWGTEEAAEAVDEMAYEQSVLDSDKRWRSFQNKTGNCIKAARKYVKNIQKPKKIKKPMQTQVNAQER